MQWHVDDEAALLSSYAEKPERQRFLSSSPTALHIDKWRHMLQATTEKHLAGFNKDTVMSIQAWAAVLMILLWRLESMWPWVTMFGKGERTEITTWAWYLPCHNLPLPRNRKTSTVKGTSSQLFLCEIFITPLQTCQPETTLHTVTPDRAAFANVPS